MCNLCNTVKIGTEFTFRREEFVFGLEALAWNKQKSGKKASADPAQIKQIEAAGVEIINWVNYIAEMGNAGKIRGKNTLLEHVEVKPGRKHHESDHYEAREVTLTLQYKYKTQFFKQTWIVNFDLDPNCIELQTQPVTFEFYDRYRDIINALFFRRESCPPDPRWQVGGGGHISLDLETAFNHNLRWFMNFLVLYADAVRGDDYRYEALRSSEDVGNAPFLHEIGELTAFSKVINAFEKMPGATIGELAHVINTDVYTRIDEHIDGSGVTREDYPHYQAVNLEHINTGVSDHRTPVNEQRVEMRRFDAQRNVDELLGELRCLYELLEESRSGNNYSLDDDGMLVQIP